MKYIPLVLSILFAPLCVAQSLPAPKKGGGSVIGNGGDPITEFFLDRGQFVVNWLTHTDSGKTILSRNKIDPTDLQSVLKKSHLRVLTSPPNEFSDNYGSESFARLNLEDGVLELNQQVWTGIRLNQTKNMEWLVFHEILRLSNWHQNTNYEDDNFEISRQFKSELSQNPASLYVTQPIKGTFYWNSDLFYGLKSPYFQPQEYIEQIFEKILTELNGTVLVDHERGLLESPTREQLDVFPSPTTKNIPVANFSYTVLSPIPQLEPFFKSEIGTLSIDINDPEFRLTSPINGFESPTYRSFLVSYLKTILLSDKNDSIFTDLRYDFDTKMLILKYKRWELR